ncbi:hypothetical protein HCBG_09044 [Histoplasma capsulatum G186AR]|uniref:Uncharacterized protein n=1 Tax=Ajellomyces capsulatus (strain G186AR / H82 / ATCC MYA-2454 / RMSCC 2432) TaxID=447093 RepID=C0P0W4_AJECG|nr:uncharacterized protein HCBG_09044 [Histoplasma capsulatum G186AR]EEH02764.1 hypothetical protein HCBG_09044 [Histoplasma capsulatum G186AR]
MDMGLRAGGLGIHIIRNSPRSKILSSQPITCPKPAPSGNQLTSQCQSVPVHPVHPVPVSPIACCQSSRFPANPWKFSGCSGHVGTLRFARLPAAVTDGVCLRVYFFHFRCPESSCLRYCHETPLLPLPQGPLFISIALATKALVSRVQFLRRQTPPLFSQRSTRRLVLDLTSESKLQYSPFHSHPPSPAQLAPLGSFDLAASTWSDLAVPATLICPRNYPVPVTSLGHRLRSDLRRGKTLADIPIPIPRLSQARPSTFVPGPIIC